MNHPAVFPIRPSDARLVLKGFPGCEALPPLRYDSSDVFRMNGRRPLPSRYVLQRKADIFQPTLIEEVEVAVRQRGVDQGRNRINQILNVQGL